MQLLIDSVSASLLPLFPPLTDAALKGIVLLAAITLTMLPLRRASADARHLAWLCGIVGLLILPILAALLPDWRVLPRWVVAARSRTLPVSAQPARTASLPPVPGSDEHNLEVVSVLAGKTLLPEAAMARFVPRQPQAMGTTSQTDNWLVLGWLAGAALGAVRLFVGYGRLHLATRRAHPLTNGALMDALRSAAATLGLRRRVRLLVDPRRTIPLAWGVFQPRLILPAEAAAWDAGRSRAIFLHELAHIKRGDLLVLLLTQVACMIHWFNPFVWLAAWRLHVERERACDDLVLATGVKASAYAEHLLHVASQLEACAPLGSLAMARPSRLEGRLLALLNGEINRSAPTARVVALFLLALTVVLVPLAMLRGADERNPGPAVQPPEPSRKSVAPPIPSPETPRRAAANQPAASPKESQQEASTANRLLEAIDTKGPRATATVKPKEPSPVPEERRREINLLSREIDVAAEQLKRASQAYEVGQMSIDRVMQQQRELVLLKIEQAKIKNDFAALEKAIREQMDLVAKLREAEEKRVEAGVSTGDSILSLERELLRLERELTAANAGRRRNSQNLPEEKAPGEEDHRREEIRKAESDLALLLNQYRPAHPAVKKMQERIDALKDGALASVAGPTRFARRRELQISAPKAGIIHQVLVGEGVKVKAGDCLVVFDDRQAKVKLETSRAQLEAAKASLRLEEIAVQGASAELERIKEMVAAQLIPRGEADTKQRTYEAAQAGVAKAKAEYAVVEQQLRQAELELELLKVLSPKTGTVLRVNVLAGEHTSPANDPLIVIGD